MKRWLVRIFFGLLTSLLFIVCVGYFTLRSMGIFREPNYDTQAPVLPELSRPSVLVFYKTGGYIHEQAIPAVNTLFTELASQRGYSIYVTDNGAVINPKQLSHFDVVVWNNNTGSVLSKEQRRHFQSWLEAGGKWLGLHSASDNHFSWPWYVKEVIGARFTGATRLPPQPLAKLTFEQRAHPVLVGLPETLWLRDEFYSFSSSPRANSSVLATVDEATYIDQQALGVDSLRMGDHPMIWSRNVGNGTALYSALGHRAEAYAIPEYRTLLDNALVWLISGAPVDNAHSRQSKPNMH